MSVNFGSQRGGEFVRAQQLFRTDGMFRSSNLHNHPRNTQHVQSESTLFTAFHLDPEESRQCRQDGLYMYHQVLL